MFNRIHCDSSRVARRLSLTLLAVPAMGQSFYGSLVAS